MHISLTAEKIFDLGPLPVTNALLTTWLVLIVAAIFAVVFHLRLKKKPKGIQNAIEAIIDGFHGLMESITNSARQARKFFPYIFTIFIFVLLNNWVGLIPGVGSIGIHEISEPTTVHEELVKTPYTEAHLNEDHFEPIGIEAKEEHSNFVPIFRAGSADLSFTLALAIIAVVLVQIIGSTTLGGWNYFSRFLNFKSPISFFVGILEIISEFSKMISFSFRLFGNIFAGEVLLAVMIALVPYVIPTPFYALEVFVGLIQALVFAALTLVFFNIASAKSH